MAANVTFTGDLIMPEKLSIPKSIFGRRLELFSLEMVAFVLATLNLLKYARFLVQWLAHNVISLVVN